MFESILSWWFEIRCLVDAFEGYLVEIRRLDKKIGRQIFGLFLKRWENFEKRSFYQVYKSLPNNLQENS
jgi:hypothetical protein